MPEQKRILINGTLVDGVSREQFINWINDHDVTPDTWELVRKRILLEPMFKVGESVGLVGFMDCETEEEALGLLKEFPVVSEGMVEFTAERVSRVAHFD